MMNKKLEKKIVLQGPYEDVLFDENKHYHIINKLDRICVLPYTISDDGLLDKIGVIKELDVNEEKENYTLISDYISQDDPTNLVCANRLMYEIIGSNVTKADDWMYLGNLNNSALSNEIIVYCVNISDVNINESEEVEENKKARKFEMVEAGKVAASDDVLFLATYMRVFNYFYVNSLK